MFKNFIDLFLSIFDKESWANSPFKLPNGKQMSVRTARQQGLFHIGPNKFGLIERRRNESVARKALKELVVTPEEIGKIFCLTTGDSPKFLTWKEFTELNPESIISWMTIHDFDLISIKSN